MVTQIQFILLGGCVIGICAFLFEKCIKSQGRKTQTKTLQNNAALLKLHCRNVFEQMLQETDDERMEKLNLLLNKLSSLREQLRHDYDKSVF